MRKIMACLDVGSSFTKLVVGETTGGRFNLLAVCETKTSGMKKNQIVSKEEVKESIKKVFDEAKSILKIPIKKTLVIIPSNHVEFTIGEATIRIKDDDKVIDGSDISKVLSESTSGIIPDNMELINTIPMYFKLDNDEYVTSPIGCISSRLSAKSVVFMTNKKNVYDVLSILEELGIEDVDISIDVIGDYHIFKDEKLDKQIGAIINIGASKTSVAIFNKGVLTNVGVVELGGNNIDNDISYVYKIDIEKAKELKENFSFASTRYASLKDEKELRNQEGKDIKISQEEISKIVHSRLKEIINNTKKEINHLTKKNISYIIVTGGVSESADFKLVVEELLGKNAILGKINVLGARNNKYSSALGVIKWYNSIQELKNRDYSIFTIEEQEEFSGVHKQGIADNSVISKVFSYFLDN